MIAKIEEMLGYDNKTEDWSGEPSALWIELFDNDVRIFYSEFNNLKEVDKSLYSKCFEYKGNNFENDLPLIMEEVKKFNERWDTDIDKIIFDTKGKEVEFFNKKNFIDGIFIYKL